MYRRFNSLLFSSTTRRFRTGKKKVLPPELSKNVLRLTCDSSTKTGVCDVYVIGTVHCYPKCIQDVTAVVKFLKPEAVFLEMCSDSVFPKDSSKYKIKFAPVLKANSKLDEVEDEVENEFEDEFDAAMAEAYKLGAKIIFGDRRLQISCKRFREKFGRLSWLQILEMRRIGQPKMPPYCAYEMSATSLNEWDSRAKSPIINEIWVDERDQYMSAMLLKVARKHNLVVAVVGKSHLLGMQKYWTKTIEVEQLLSTPSEMKSFSSRVKLAISYCIFPYYFFRFGLHFGVNF